MTTKHTAHTPGPWTFAPLSTASRFKATRQEERYGIYADAAPEGHRMPAETQGLGNARLVAAAPEMELALEPWANIAGDASIRNAIRAALRPAERETFDAACENTLAALKKAKGEE